MGSIRSTVCACLLLEWVVIAVTAVPSTAASGYRPPPVFPGVRSVLWVGAHPDDESLAAPLLARLCVDEGLACTFLIVTRGEGGHCLLPAGCLPDLATVRSKEMRRSAQSFGARLALWDLPDGGATADGEPGAWDVVSGGHAALVARLATFVATNAPDLVLTFDPRHGSTCHGDHRAIGGLVVEAIGQESRQPRLELLEVRYEIARDPGAALFRAAAGAADGAFAFDANAERRGVAGSEWQALVETLQIHRSQFAPALVQAFVAAPRRNRTVAVGPAELLLTAPGVWSCGQ